MLYQEKENIFTWGEFVTLNRDNENWKDTRQAQKVARDLDVLLVKGKV